MREIKFRAWDKNEKKWMFNKQSFSIIGEVTVFDLIGQISCKRYRDIEIVQFTGLNDKNGKEIYEGDILRHDDGTITQIPTIIPVSNQLMDDAYSWSELDWEVIGNIYENPELLRG